MEGGTYPFSMNCAQATVAAGPSKLGLELARQHIVPGRAVRLGGGDVGRHFGSEAKSHRTEEEQS